MIKSKSDAIKLFGTIQQLAKSGRQKNFIFAWQNIVYGLNSDKTIILRMETEQPISEEPISFFADDYESHDFKIEGGKIEFFTSGEEWNRKKITRIPDKSFEEVEILFFKYFQDYDQFPKISFHKNSLSLLQEDLSHIEFLVRDKKIYILQRDIYSGSIVELTRKEEGLGFSLQEDDLKNDFGPLGIRTTDFFSLFYFNDKINIYFTSSYFIITGEVYNLTGIIAGCLYDHIGELLTTEIGETESRNND